MIHPEIITPKNFGLLADVSGNFSKTDGKFTSYGNCHAYENERIKYNADVEKHGDIITRQDSITALEDTDINKLEARFILEDGEYEIYTQYNGWQHESEGVWLPLRAGFDLMGNSARTSNGDVPFFAIYNRQTCRGIVFHLVPFSKWHISVKRIPENLNFNYIEIKMGLSPDGLNLKIKKGVTIQLPKILYYTFYSKTDLDAYKLHGYINHIYPRKTMPTIYNTWLCCYDSLETDFILKQVKKVAEAGIEYFVIDAGWFGSGDTADGWTDCVGDYTEAVSYGFKGKMNEVSEAVRKHGMKFGLWLELERAVENSEAVSMHPDFYIKNGDYYFLDFGNSFATEYMLKTVIGLCTEYGVSFLKLDFNGDLEDDGRQDALLTYFSGYRNFLTSLREYVADIYIEGCSSGGLRTNLSCGCLYDSIWPTDNQSIYKGVKMFAATTLRCPPQWLEKWVSLQSYTDYTPSYGKNALHPSERILSISDGDADTVEGVKMSYVNGFTECSTVGISCDLTKLSDNTFNEIKKIIRNQKDDREFIINSLCRVLTDTDKITVFEFFDESFDDIRILVFTENSTQRFTHVYPFVDTNKNYSCDKGDFNGKELSENGLGFLTMKFHEAQILRLKSI